MIARQVGAPGPELVVVAHRDAARPGSAAELSGTAALLELARVVAGGRLRRTITFVSTSGGSGGAAGARDLARRLGRQPDRRGARPRRRRQPRSRASRSSRRGRTARESRRCGCGARSPRRSARRSPRARAAPALVTQWARLAFPGAIGEQGPLVGARPARGAAVGQRRAPARGGRRGRREPPRRLRARRAARARRARRGAGARRARRAATSSRCARCCRRGPSGCWSARSCSPRCVVTVDGFARVRRRRQPVAPWLGWIGAAAAPFALAAAFATRARGHRAADGDAARAGPRRRDPVDGAGRAALVATGLVLRRSSVARAPAASCGSWRPAADLEGPGGGAALLLVWPRSRRCCGSSTRTPPRSSSRPRTSGCSSRRPASGCGAGRAGARGVVAAAVRDRARSSIAGQLGLGPLDVVWALLLAVAGGQIGPDRVAVLERRRRLRRRRGRARLAPRRRPARRARRAAHHRARPASRTPGPGSLGGTESALRR